MRQQVLIEGVFYLHSNANPSRLCPDLLGFLFLIWIHGILVLSLYTYKSSLNGSPAVKTLFKKHVGSLLLIIFFFTSLNALSFQSFCNAIVNFILALSYLYNWQLLQRHHCAFIWTQFGPTSGKPPFSLTQLTPPVGASVIGFLKKQTLCSYCTSRLSVTLT